MADYAESLARLVEAFGTLPGIGPKTAERCAYHVLKTTREEALELADAIRLVKEGVRHCASCYNFTESEQCTVCRDPSRDATTLCVVEDPRDLAALERANAQTPGGGYRGRYHVLLGTVSPLEGVGPDDLTIRALAERVRRDGIQEIIIATNPTLAGDATALHVVRALAGGPARVTRLARGIPSGTSLEYVNHAILSEALSGRRVFESEGSR